MYFPEPHLASQPDIRQIAERAENEVQGGYPQQITVYGIVEPDRKRRGDCEKASVDQEANHELRGEYRLEVCVLSFWFPDKSLPQPRASYEPSQPGKDLRRHQDAEVGGLEKAGENDTHAELHDLPGNVPRQRPRRAFSDRLPQSSHRFRRE